MYLIIVIVSYTPKAYSKPSAARQIPEAPGGPVAAHNAAGAVSSAMRSGPCDLRKLRLRDLGVTSM